MEPAARFLELDGPTGDEEQSSRTRAASPQTGSSPVNRNSWIVHYTVAKSPALRRYLKTKDVYERLAVGLPNADAHNELLHKIHHLQSQLGEPTEEQRLAGKAALDRICARCGPPMKPTTDVIVSDGPQSAPQSTIHSSTAATSLIETTRSTETAQTSLGSEALSMTSPDVVRSDLAHTLKANVPKPSRRWPCDAGCYAVFETQDDLNHHKHNMHSARLWTCPLCHREFTELPPFRDHVEICDHREAKSPRIQDATCHTPKPCGYCERDAAQCHAQWGLDGHSAEYMPAGAWDLSVFDRELSAVAMSEVSSISPQLLVTPNRYALGSSIPELSRASTEPTQRVACISPLEFLALWPGNGSEADTDFDLDRDVFLDAWEYEIVSTLINQIYAWLNKNGYKIGWACAEGEQQSGANGSRSLELSHPNPSHPSSRKRAYREGHTAPPSESSVDSEGRQERKMLKPSGDQADLNNKKRRFACPYWKANTALWRNRNCTNENKGWKNLSRLRGHLCRVHKEDMSLISKDSLQKWVGREDMDDEETWHTLFNRLIPSYRSVYGNLPSPYYTPVEVVPGQNSIQKSLEHLSPDDQKSVILQHLMPTAMPVIKHHLDREPEETRPRLKPKIEEFAKDLLIHLSEIAVVGSWLTLSKFILQQDTMSQLSTMSNARVTSNSAVQPSDYGQTLYNTSFPWKDWTTLEPWNAIDNGALGTEQRWVENSPVPVPYHSQPNLGMIDQPFAPSSGALRHGPILDEAACQFDAGGVAQSDGPSIELASLGADTGQFISRSERNDSGYASRPGSFEAYFQLPPANCPSGSVDCFSCTHLN